MDTHPNKSKSQLDRIEGFITKRKPERFTVQEIVNHFSFNSDAKTIRKKLEILVAANKIKSELKNLPTGLTEVYYVNW